MIYHTTATLEIAGDELDVSVRACVDVEPGAGIGGGHGAVMSGDMEAWWDGRWVDFDDLGIDASTRERLEESFAELAFQDDGGADRADYLDE